MEWIECCQHLRETGEEDFRREEERRKSLQSCLAWKKKKMPGRSLLNRLACTIQWSWGDLIVTAQLEWLQNQTFTVVHPYLVQDFRNIFGRSSLRKFAISPPNCSANRIVLSKVWKGNHEEVWGEQRTEWNKTWWKGYQRYSCTCYSAWIRW